MNIKNIYTAVINNFANLNFNYSKTCILSITFLLNKITLIDEYYDRVGLG